MRALCFVLIWIMSLEKTVNVLLKVKIEASQRVDPDVIEVKDDDPLCTFYSFCLLLPSDERLFVGASMVLSEIRDWW